MAQDVVALGQYQRAKEQMENAFVRRRNYATDLQILASTVSHGQVIEAGVVKRFHIGRAQEILNQMSVLEEEIASAITVMNANAPKCGKPVMRLSN
jgi:hypothetical protein